MRRITSNDVQRIFLSGGSQVILEEALHEGQPINHLIKYYDGIILNVILAEKRGK